MSFLFLPEELHGPIYDFHFTECVLVENGGRYALKDSTTRDFPRALLLSPTVSKPDNYVFASSYFLSFFALTDTERDV